VYQTALTIPPVLWYACYAEGMDIQIHAKVYFEKHYLDRSTISKLRQNYISENEKKEGFFDCGNRDINYRQMNWQHLLYKD
jgi:hypothetical protein